MGYGTLTKESKSNSVTASGSLEADELTLTVQSAESEYSGQIPEKYDIVLSMANSSSINAMSGTYVLSSGGEYVGDGKAMAVKR